MKYYAVADDPNELLHYGRLGMKWGQNIFVGPKSLSYKNAERKLRTKIQNAKAVVQKNRAQRAAIKQQKQQNKFNKAVAKAQRRIALAEGFRNIDQLKAYERSDARAYRNERKMAKISEKTARAEAKNELRYANNERKMEKYTQMARQGKLKYGKLSPDQVNQITNRLAIEANARRLGSAEKTWHQQKKEAFRSGKLEGIKRGTAAAMEEVARAGAIYGIQNIRKRMKLNAEAKQQGKEEKLRNRERNKRSRHEIKQDVKQEALETIYENKSHAAKKAQKAQLEAQYNKRLEEAKYLDSRKGQKLLTLENKNDIMKKLKSAEAYDSDSGRKLFALESRNDIMKKLAAAKEKDSDSGRELQRFENEAEHNKTVREAWQKHLSEGGSDQYMDKAGHVYKLNDDSELAKTNPKLLTELRRQSIESDKKAKEESEQRKAKLAYNQFVKEQKAEEERKNRKQATEAVEERYKREVAKIEASDKQHNEKLKSDWQKECEAVDRSNARKLEAYEDQLARSRYTPGIVVERPVLENKPKEPTNKYITSPKPDHDRYVSKTAIDKELQNDYYKTTSYPTYEKALEYQRLGLPSPLNSQKDKNKGNKGGNKKG